MNRILVFVLLLGISVRLSADINFIDLKKISADEKLQSELNYLTEHQTYYNHWSPKWEYPVTKEELIHRLSKLITNIHALNLQTTETYLLQGDIAHYMYNMDNQDSFKAAVENYEKAIESAPGDYRGYWFLGNHYSMANVPLKAMQNLSIAESKVQAKAPVEFWNGYGLAASMANMPSHCIYAMDKVTEQLGSAGYLETTIGQSLLERFVTMKIASTYENKDLWTARHTDKIEFISRPLGMKLRIDSTWNVNVYKYEKRSSGFVILPPKLNGVKGMDIGYTIAILFRLPTETETLESYISKLYDKQKAKVSEINFSTKYEKIKAFEIVDKTMYKNRGGGHMYLIGVERDVPRYPGLLFENPEKPVPSKAGELQYFHPGKINDRFKSRIFYSFILDTCGDIHEASLEVFKKLFETDMLIE
ncbi:MAG: hypothetical protein WCG08_10755 [Paludibacter sp.]